MQKMSKNFCYTLNNPTPREIRSLQDITCEVCAFHIYQHEVGANGTPHLQGYIQLLRRRSIKSAKKVLGTRCHIQVARGTPAENEAYCTKEGGHSQYRLGEPIFQGKRTDLSSFVSLIKEGHSNKQLIESDPNNVARFPRLIQFVRDAYITHRNWEMVNTVYWGPSGSGKTRRATEEAGEDVYWLSKGDSNQSVWWDNYNGQDAVILDDFYGWIPWSMLLRLLDRYPFSVQCKGGSRPFTSKRVFITSNSEPASWYKNVPNNDMTPLIRRLNKIENLLYLFLLGHQLRTRTFIMGGNGCISNLDVECSLMVDKQKYLE